MGQKPAGVRCGDTNYMTATLFLVAHVMLGMARHANAGFGFTRQGSRGANAGGHRGC
jgi:hypothetical protein